MSDHLTIEVKSFDKSQDDPQNTINDLQGHPETKDPQDPQDDPLLEISPNGKYLVLYSDSKEGKKYIGWNVKNIKVGEYVVENKQVEDGYEKESENKQVKKEVKYKQDRLVEVPGHERRILHMCVSDN